MADHEGNEWEWQSKKFKTEPGQFVTSLKSITEKAGKGISIQNVRTSLDKFKKYEFLTYESTKTGRLITITNWTLYQAKKEKVTKELTDDQQSINKELTTNKNERIKEGIPLKKESKIFSNDEVLNAYNNIINVNINEDNADINQVNDNISTQRKEKKRKEYIYSDSFTETLKLYPGKKVKSIRDKKLPNIVNEYGEEQIKRCMA